MAETEKRPGAEAPLREEESQPKLSADFFQQLLNPPSCKTTGVCDNCGRCEH